MSRNELRVTSRNIRLKVGATSVGRFEACMRELVAGDAELAALVEPLLSCGKPLA